MLKERKVYNKTHNIKKDVTCEIDDKTCNICLTNKVFKSKKCKKCKVCFSCQDQWFSEQIKTQINDPSITDVSKLKISCSSCKRKVEHSEILSTQKFYPNTFQQKTNFYLKRNEEFYSCPSGNCSNIGWMDKKDCNDLKCTACNTQWKKQSIKNSLENLTRTFIFAELLTKLFKLSFTKSCPNCDAAIYKIGGCKKMTCGKCRHCFCWKCKSAGHYNFQLKCFLICLFSALVFVVPFNYFLSQFGIYSSMINQLSEFFTFSTFVYEYQFIYIFPFIFRFIYKHGLFILVAINFFERNVHFFVRVLLVLDIILWIFFTRWTEVLYYLVITPQLILSLIFFFD